MGNKRRRPPELRTRRGVATRLNKEDIATPSAKLWKDASVLR